jgi:hypothetical protein
MRPTFDERDEEIRARRSVSLTKNPINVGDFIRFACGTTRRVSYIWTDEHGKILPAGIQTSAGGSYYLADGYVSFSGALYAGVPFESLVDTGDLHDGDVWFFHHDFATAHNGVHTTAKFRVWCCNLPAERC